MRVLCRNGFYSFYPRNETDVSRFCSFYKVELVREMDYYTFKNLKGLETYSLKGLLYSNTIALETFEGMPWEILEINNLVYSIALGLLVPKDTITILADVKASNFYYLAGSGLLQSGAVTSSGKKLKSFDAEYYFDIHKLRIREIEYA